MVLVVSDLWLVISVALLGGSLLAQKEYRELDAAGMTTGSFIETLERLDRMDAYNDQSYKVNLMGNALQAGGISNEAQPPAVPESCVKPGSSTPATMLRLTTICRWGSWKTFSTSCRRPAAGTLQFRSVEQRHEFVYPGIFTN